MINAVHESDQNFVILGTSTATSSQLPLQHPEFEESIGFGYWVYLNFVPKNNKET